MRPDFIDLPEWGAVVVKHYVRGGWIRFLNRRSYLRCGRSRCRAEFEMLLRLSGLGFDVPRPLAWVERGTLWVHAWLIMEERTQAVTLAELSRTEAARARAVLPQLADAVGRLIEHGIHHVDLHPGNVLVDASDRVCLIDFDKAAEVTWARPELAERYRRRWQRAVVKHNLPSWLQDGLHLPGPG